MSEQVRMGEWQADDVGGEDEGDEELNEDGVLFYVNKSGCPMDERSWERMWDHVAKLHPDGYSMIYKIRDKTDLPDVSIPRYQIPAVASTPEKIEIAQKYMEQLQYNHTGTQFYEIRKNRPISGLMDTAKDMMQEALPIKCLEAIILGSYLTNGLSGVDRFPLSFKSNFLGNTHRHVVLGIYYNGQYGAIGMSRRRELMYKPLIFKSLSKMVLDFIRSYKKYMHVVKKVMVGLHIPHDAHSYEQIHWKALAIKLAQNKGVTDDQCREIDRHAREMRSQQYRPPGIEYPPKKPSVLHMNGAGKKKRHRASSEDKTDKKSSELCGEPKPKPDMQQCEESAPAGEPSVAPKPKLISPSYQVRM